jgi:hypothetical protein
MIAPVGFAGPSEKLEPPVKSEGAGYDRAQPSQGSCA